MSKVRKIRGRYKPNPQYGGRKERDGYVCGDKSPWLVWCVAVKRDARGVHVRDTKDPADKTLSFTKGEWKAFIGSVKEGQFDV